MVKNVPLLISMLLIGLGALTVSQNAQLPEPLHWVLIIMSVILNMTSAIGLILNLGIQKLYEN
ncbi:hypothetical protein N780_06165 [Pontibacillus chungwhensis BH030062]|uniref:Uncharacterized protein n=1 Tax=Pontibacillus chungwhensis BH030062 TaxID=1385513 RepID=A0A0A2UU47_9BACI|nr:hypothetical protein [Pontibacillus chungwhensis]KGP90273.1 hypothetical protein N780_06165 [Pontibacillus chungwhensis BH030062]